MKKSVITLCNEKVDIFMVCSLIGMSVVPTYDVRSIKVYCPFGEISHSDFGVSKAMRIYPHTNSAYCFACQKAYWPVNLAATAWDRDPKEVAVELLSRIGYQSESLEDVWNSVQPNPLPPDLSMLGLALRVFCEREDPAWQTRQFEPDVSELLDSCLSLLSNVRTEQDAEEWLRGTKQVMKNLLDS